MSEQLYSASCVAVLLLLSGQRGKHGIIVQPVRRLSAKSIGLFSYLNSKTQAKTLTIVLTFQVCQKPSCQPLNWTFLWFLESDVSKFAPRMSFFVMILTLNLHIIQLSNHLIIHVNKMYDIKIEDRHPQICLLYHSFSYIFKLQTL